MCEWKPFTDAPKDGREILIIGIAIGSFGYTGDEIKKFTVKWNGDYWRFMQPQPNGVFGFMPKFYIDIPNDPEIICI